MDIRSRRHSGMGGRDGRCDRCLGQSTVAQQITCDGCLGQSKLYGYR